MKKSVVSFAAIAISLFFLLTGCQGVGDVITQNPREYVYQAKEEIKFYDNVTTGDLLASFTCVSMIPLSDETFTIQEEAGEDENGDTVYKEVKYEQLIQINYVFTPYSDLKDIAKELRIIDENGESGIKNPPVEYTEVPVTGMDSLVVALKNKSDTIKIQVYYSGIVTPNATVKLTKEDSETSFDETAKNENPDSQTIQEENENPNPQTIQELEAELEEKNTLIRQYESELKEKNALVRQYEQKAERQRKTTAILYWMLLFLCVLAVAELSGIIVLWFKRKK